ncbi:MAG: MarR family winged helix-turn-helix transcriptional regulator [Granulosicoccus sp.]
MVDISEDEDIREAIELLYLGYRAFTNRADRLLDKRGLGRAHHRILYFIGRDPDASVADLLDALAISKQALHVPLRQLISMGLVDSQQSSHDGRVKMLKLTPSGRRLEARLTGVQAKLLKQMFDQVGPDAEDAWRAAMQVLASDPI